MKGFSKQDYVTAVVIIVGVITCWFLFLAGLFKLIRFDYAFSFIVLISLIIYFAIKKNNPRK